VKIKQILVFAIAILLSTYAFFRFISFKKNSLSLNSHLDNNSQPTQKEVAFNIQSKFDQYSIDHNSINQQLLNDIAHDLKLDADGWSQFGIFDLVHPTQVKFIFADIEVDPIV